MSILKLISQICNGIVSATIILAFFLIFIYYVSIWAEGHIKKITQLIQLASVFALFMSVLLLFTDFSILEAGVSIVANLLWTILLFTGFPFIEVTRPDFLIALLFTAFNHFGWMIHFLGTDYSSTFIISSFVLYVWQVPILAVASLTAIDEETIQTKHGHSAWTNVFKTVSNTILRFIPHSSHVE